MMNNIKPLYTKTIDHLKVSVYPDRRALGAAAGADVAATIRSLLSTKPNVRMIFAAAPSQNEMLETLVAADGIDWPRVTAFHMDEYIGLPEDAPQRFARYLRDRLFDRVKPGRVHLINSSNSIDDECRRYGALLREAPIDIVCLGIGENGHIAFNDPPVADFNDPLTIKPVALDDACRQQQVNDGCFPSFASVPTHAVTLTIPTLLAGAHLYCSVPGPTKRQAVSRTLSGPISTQCPSTILRQHPDCTLYADAATGQPISIGIENGVIHSIDPIDPRDPSSADLPIVAPGLVDLQINGFAGHDVNAASIVPETIEQMIRALWREGVTTCYPTVITNSSEAIVAAMQAIAQACERDAHTAQGIAGIHLEGPFISPDDGARGAHDRQFVRPPHWDDFRRWQDAAGGRIKIITMSPEWPNSPDFISRCAQTGVTVSIGHTSAIPQQIADAVRAGARMSTHLGNGAHLMLPRHPNYLWEQLAQDDLWTCLIADGFHVPDQFVKVVLKVKGDRALLVSDAVSLAGMPPGDYTTAVGGRVTLTPHGRLHLAENEKLLAGSAQTLLKGIEHLTRSRLASLADAWNMASTRPAAFMNLPSAPGLAARAPADLALFRHKDNRILIDAVYKSGDPVFVSSSTFCA
jgi:glucosamine-6-phosphate deaminase